MAAAASAQLKIGAANKFADPHVTKIWNVLATRDLHDAPTPLRKRAVR